MPTNWKKHFIAKGDDARWNRLSRGAYMAEDRQKPKIGPTPKTLVVLAFLLLSIGGAVLDPLAGVACFALAGVVSLIVFFMGSGWTRYAALVLLIAALALAISNYSNAGRHHQKYKSQAASSSIE